MFDRFFPDEYVASTYIIPFEKLYKEGYRGVIFDIDNTLVPHGAPADKRAKELFGRLESIGFATCLISNNQEPRVKMFNEEIGTRYIFNARKPARKNYIRAMEMMETDRTNTIFVGDQLFTDVWGAKRAGIRNILVKPMRSLLKEWRAQGICIMEDVTQSYYLQSAGREADYVVD